MFKNRGKFSDGDPRIYSKKSMGFKIPGIRFFREMGFGTRKPSLPGPTAHPGIKQLSGFDNFLASRHLQVQNQAKIFLINDKIVLIAAMYFRKNLKYSWPCIASRKTFNSRIDRGR